VYRPTGAGAAARPGTLAHWLTERYRLYAVDGRGGLRRAGIDHAPWPLQPAEADIQRNTMTAGLGFELPRTAPLVHFAARVDVRVGPPEAVPAG
jgi:uncharacterized protein YqjF (DUF2071 family)